MHSSTLRAPLPQPHSDTNSFPRFYIATSGQDLVETGLTLDWITAALEERCRHTGEDLALWMIEGGNAPWIVAAIRPAPDGAVTVQWL